ncbi:MAG: hypothetical protein D6694_08625, partial [Gammaproteobacteria bacterium]
SRSLPAFFNKSNPTQKARPRVVGLFFCPLEWREIHLAPRGSAIVRPYCPVLEKNGGFYTKCGFFYTKGLFFFFTCCAILL